MNTNTSLDEPKKRNVKQRTAESHTPFFQLRFPFIRIQFLVDEYEKSLPVSDSKSFSLVPSGRKV